MSRASARVRRPRRPGPAADPRAARRRRADLRGDRVGRPGRVRHLAAGRLAAPQGPARQRVRDASGRRAPGGSTPSTRRRSSEVDEWLDHFRRFWDQRLDSLATELARGKRERRLAATPPTRSKGGRPDDRHRPRDRGRPARGRQGTHRRRRGPRRSGCGATYDAPIEDVWDALTNPERIGRWFLPISGDYRLGGRYQFEGNAGGEIVACERPNRLRVTWVYGEPAARPTSRRSSCGSTPSAAARRRSSSSTPRSCPRSSGPSTGRAPSASAGRAACSGSRSTCAAARSAIPIAWQLSDEGREFNTPEQRGVGRREPGRRRGSGGGRHGGREHDRVLRAGSGDREVALFVGGRRRMAGLASKRG